MLYLVFCFNNCANLVNLSFSGSGRWICKLNIFWEARLQKHGAICLLVLRLLSKFLWPSQRTWTFMLFTFSSLGHPKKIQITQDNIIWTLEGQDNYWNSILFNLVVDFSGLKNTKLTLHRLNSIKLKINKKNVWSIINGKQLFLGQLEYFFFTNLLHCRKVQNKLENSRLLSLQTKLISFHQLGT